MVRVFTAEDREVFIRALADALKARAVLAIVCFVESLGRHFLKRFLTEARDSPDKAPNQVAE